MKKSTGLISLEPYKGVRDFYPDEMRRLRYVFGIWRRVLERYGYEEYMSSVLEPAGLYEAKSGEEIVTEQTYRFQDRAGRDVVLRPEMTPTVARMVAKRRRELGFPLRWYSIPNLFRYESPQRGRLREHWQLNADLFGTDSEEADVEILSLACGILSEFGAKAGTYVVKISDVRFLPDLLTNDLKLNAESVHPLIKLLDRKGKLPEEEFSRRLLTLIGSESAKMLEPLIHAGETLLNRMTRDPSAGRASALVNLLKRNGINARLEPFLTRGFDYYTGMIFEIYDTDSRNKRSIFGGGRYDDLLRVFGSGTVPAVGFGLGDVTMAEFLTAHALWPDLLSSVQIALCRAEGASDDFYRHVAIELRAKGLHVVSELRSRRIADQIKAAEQARIPFIICIGGEEEQSRTFRLKELRTRNEESLTLEGVVNRIIQAVK